MTTIFHAYNSHAVTFHLNVVLLVYQAYEITQLALLSRHDLFGPQMIVTGVEFR